MCVSKQQDSLKCNQFVQEDLSNGIFGLISHSVIQGQERWWNCPRPRGQNTPVMGEESSKGTRERLDRRCLDEVFSVLKESLVVINSACGKQFLHLWAGFCCQWHGLMSILWLHISALRSSCSGGALALMCPCGHSVCVREAEWGKYRLESKIIPPPFVCAW